MKVLYVASEAHPFIKTGGLADVAGSLPKRLNEEGIETRLVLPLFGKIPDKYRSLMEYEGYFYVDMDWRHQYCGIFSLVWEGVTVYFLDSQFYFHRDLIYGEADDGERFIFFSKAVVMLPKIIGWKPDIIHSNDWHSGMVPVFLEDFRRGDTYYQSIRSVYTIHNLKYQGIYPAEILGTLAGLSPFYFNEDALKFHDSINFMKGGIVFANGVTTVSESYSKEIQDPYFGEGLDGLLRQYNYKLHGIVNGIDYDVWNPETDPHIPSNFSALTLEDKVKNKTQLQTLYNLPIREDVPMISIVSRLVEAKGLDLINYIMDQMLQDDIQIVVLGTGEQKYEDSFHYFAWRYPEKFSFRNYYSDPESHMIYAASDLYLMPSIYEACGISQMISMRYGALPIVRETGGLRDTVLSYNEYTGEGNGFTFHNINAHDLLHTIRRALYYYKQPDVFTHIQKNAMTSDYSWERSGKLYKEVYELYKA